MTKPGNVRDEVQQLSKAIRAAQQQREAEPAYVLQLVPTLFVQAGWPTDLATARADAARLPKHYQGDVRICRLEPVESKRGRK